MKIALAFLLCISALSFAAKPNGQTGKTTNAPKEEPKLSTVAFIDNNATTPEANCTAQEPPEWYATSWAPEWALFLVGIAGVIVAICTIKSIEGQVAETRRQTALQFRPKFKVRGMRLIAKPTPVYGAKPEEWQIEIAVSNIGGTTAQVVASNLTVIRGRLPAIPRYNDLLDSFGNFSLEAGEETQRISDMLPDDTASFRWLMLHIGGGSTDIGDIFCCGFIQYRDETGIIRRTAFLRQFNGQTQEFQRVKNPDYVYSN